MSARTAFKCPIPTCTKSFAVRSNAKRHLRTHGIFPSSDPSGGPPGSGTGAGGSPFTVGFETPLVSEVHEAGRLPPKLRWVPPSLAGRTNAELLRSTAGVVSPSSAAAAAAANANAGSNSNGNANGNHGSNGQGNGAAEGSDSEDEYYEPLCPRLPVPLPPVAPGGSLWGGPGEDYEERDAYATTDGAPYISTQVSPMQ